MHKPEMLWIDLETTGLDARTELPLELGLATSDKYGNVLEEKSWLIHDDTPTYKNKIVAAKQDEVVGAMHRESGLWGDLTERKLFSYGNRAGVDKAACAWLEEVGVGKFTLPMSGSSIGSLDRPFCQIHLVRLNGYFHYRNMDVSSLREACRLRNLPVHDALPESDKGHRVLADIHASIELWQFLCDEFLMTED